MPSCGSAAVRDDCPSDASGHKMTEHVVDLGGRQFRPFLEAPCQGGEEGIHNELQHEFARDRNIVSDFRQVFPYQLSEHKTDFVDGDDAACPPNIAR